MKSQKGFTLIELLVVLLVLGILAFVAVKFFAKEVKVYGKIQVVTGGAQVINMPLVDVWVFDENALQKVAREVNAAYASAKPQYANDIVKWNARKEEILYSKIDQVQLDEWLAVASKEKKKSANKDASLFAMAPNFKGSIQKIRTDTEGKFGFTLPHSGKYYFIAIGSRQLPTGVEEYFWQFITTFKKAGATYDIKITNDNERHLEYKEKYRKAVGEPAYDYEDKVSNLTLWGYLLQGHGLEENSL